jgi:hypothetical protein
MFVAKFKQVVSDRIKGDKNSQKPYIGEVLAGPATGTFINGTMFQRNGLEENVLYACENFVDEDYPTFADGTTPNYQVRIIGKVSLLEFNALRTQLGAPTVTLAKSATPEVEHEVDDRLS